VSTSPVNPHVAVQSESGARVEHFDPLRARPRLNLSALCSMADRVDKCSEEVKRMARLRQADKFLELTCTGPGGQSGRKQRKGIKAVIGICEVAPGKFVGRVFDGLYRRGANLPGVYGHRAFHLEGSQFVMDGLVELTDAAWMEIAASAISRTQVRTTKFVPLPPSNPVKVALEDASEEAEEQDDISPESLSAERQEALLSPEEAYQKMLKEADERWARE